MSTHRPYLAMAAAFALLVAGALAQAAPASKKPDAKPAAVAGEVVAYPTLEHRIGDEIVVETSLGTARRGILIKYTNPGLTLQLGPDHGSIELSIPRETVRSIRVIHAAASAAPQADTTQQPGQHRAQKN